MDLETYLRRSSQSMAGFAAQIGVSHTAVHRWIVGRAKPAWNQLAAIERATGGAVTAYDFLHPPADAPGTTIDRRKSEHRLKPAAGRKRERKTPNPQKETEDAHGS